MENKGYYRGFVPYGAAAFLVGLVGGFSALLGPAFVKDLGLAYNNTTWTALATAISSAAFAPVLGKLADAMGRRQMLTLGLGIFFLGNVLSALADSLLFMVAARFVAGIGMAAIAPVVIAYIVTEFPGEQVARGFSLYMLLSSGSVVIGPTLGAWIIDTWGWRTMLWLCSFLCALTWILCCAGGKGDAFRREALSGFDREGAVLVPIFFGLLLCVPSVGQNLGWDTGGFRVLFLFCLLSLGALLLAEKHAENPILPRLLLKRSSFWLPVGILFLTQGLMQANMTNTIVYVEYTRPEDTVVSGYAISVMYIGMALGAVLLGPLADRREPKTVLTGSLAVTGMGCAVMLLYAADGAVWLPMLSLGLLGFGLGGNGTILMKVALSGVSGKNAAVGTGTYGLFRDLSAPFGVAVLVPMFTNGIAEAVGRGLKPALAAVDTVRYLAAAEIFCVAAALLLVRLLPQIRSGKTA